jgi:diguanylate cyclase (GGDEF)-like protein
MKKRLDDILGKLDAEERALVSSLIEKDPLTGAYNRRKFEHDIALLGAMYRRNNQGSSLLIMDIDHFKEFNDRHGHQEGDRVLRLVTQVIERSLRDYDKIHLYRYGGEEFVVIIPDISTGEAVRIGERVKQNVQESCPVTLSVGISHYREISESLEELIRDADKALYDAKRKGRNRVETFGKDN